VVQSRSAYVSLSEHEVSSAAFGHGVRLPVCVCIVSVSDTLGGAGIRFG
jgi:hypothetical protein